MSKTIEEKVELGIYIGLGACALGGVALLILKIKNKKVIDVTTKPTEPIVKTAAPAPVKDSPGPQSTVMKSNPVYPPHASLLWDISALHSTWLDKAVACHLARVYVKSNDSMGGDSAWDQIKKIPEYLGRGMSVGTWSYEFTTNPNTNVVAVPVKEKILATIMDAQELGSTHHIFDLEVELESHPDRATAMVEIIKYVKANVSKPLTVGFSPFGWPSKHPNFPFKQIAAVCDFVAPQIYTCYWGADHLPLAKQIMAEWTAMKLGIPVYPMWSSENQTGVPYPLTATALQGLLDAYPGSMVFRMHDANDSTAENLKVDYKGTLTPKVNTLPAVPAKTSTVNTKMIAGYDNQAGYNKVHDNVMSWYGTTSNGCAAFFSSALRIFGGVDVPHSETAHGNTSLVTLALSDYLKSIGWTKITNASLLIPGDACFSQDDPSYPGYPAHVYCFVKWNSEPSYAFVIDNQGFMYSRNILASGPNTPFAYCLRASK